jgi:hypothetical protein
VQKHLLLYGDDFRFLVTRIGDVTFRVEPRFGRVGERKVPRGALHRCSGRGDLLRAVGFQVKRLNARVNDGTRLSRRAAVVGVGVEVEHTFHGTPDEPGQSRRAERGFGAGEGCEFHNASTSV